MADNPRSRGSWVARLRALSNGGNPEQLEHVAREALAADPLDPAFHYYLGAALVDLGRAREARPHLDFLRQHEPASQRYFWLALQIEFQRGGGRTLKRLAHEALGHFPEVDGFHYYAAVAEANLMRPQRALAHLRRARQLAPDDPDYLAFESRLTGISQSATDAWERLDDLERGLALDPESAELHNAIGDVYHHGLSDARSAEPSYAEAVRLEPDNREYQRDLFDAIARRSLFYRVFGLPGLVWRALPRVPRLLATNPVFILILLLCAKFFIGLVIWLVVVTPLFTPAAKLYEWLVVCQLRDARSLSGVRGWLYRRVAPLPLALRVALFAALLACAWALVFLLVGMELAVGFTTAGIIFGVHFLIAGTLALMRRLRSRSGRVRALRRRASTAARAGGGVVGAAGRGD